MSKKASVTKAFQFSYLKPVGKGTKRYNQNLYGYVVADSLEEASKKLTAAKINATGLTLLPNYKVIF